MKRLFLNVVLALFLCVSLTSCESCKSEAESAGEAVESAAEEATEILKSEQ